MKFSLDFNRSTKHDDILAMLPECFKEYTTDGELLGYFKEINSILELEELQFKVNELITIKENNKPYYALILNIEDGENSIYFDNEC